MTWYAVHTRPSREQDASTYLRRQGYRTWYPFIREKRWIGRAPHRRREERDRPLFSRYIFVELSKPTQSLYDVNETYGVSTVVHIAGEPLEIPGGVIDELMARTDEIGMVHQEKPPHWFQGKPGDQVQLVDELPYNGLIARLASLQYLDNRGEISIFLNMLGAEREITVPVTAVAKVNAA